MAPVIVPSLPVTETAVPDQSYIFERTPWNRPWLWMLLSAALLTADFLTGPYILFPIFFVFPVLLVAWHSRWRFALILTVILSFARQFSHGVCERCARQHYGPVFEKTRAARATKAVFRP